MAKYLVKFQPVDMFFFGQETKYRPKKESGKISYEADYFQKSAFFPQQTTILGALRYLLLQKHGQIPIQDQTTAEQLIGTESFDALQSNQQNFGKIKRLSPVFLMVDNNIHMPAPKDINENLDQLIFNFKKDNLPVIKNYEAKKSFFEGMIRISDPTEFLNYTKNEKTQKDYAFVEVEKIGINKKKTEDAFYKQISFKPNPGKNIAFVVEVEIEEDDLENKIFHIPMGAEKNTFRVEFFKNLSLPEINYKLIVKSNEPIPKSILLISDTFVDEKVNNLFYFSISETKPFRYLRNKTEKNTKYGKFSVTKQKLQLYRRGSIFFFDKQENLDAFIKAINQYRNFVQIGYNHYITL